MNNVRALVLPAAGVNALDHLPAAIERSRTQPPAGKTVVQFFH